MKPYSYTSVSATSTFALAEWVFTSYSNSKTVVLPDGCKDIILKQNEGQLDAWFLSDLDEAPYSVETQGKSNIAGIRLRPGVDVDLVRLSSWLKSNSPEKLFGTDQLDEFCVEVGNLTEALSCLATGVTAGVTTRATTCASAAATKYETAGVTSSNSPHEKSSSSSILHVAKELGVSVRTLQRLVKSGTGQSPYFWFSLARARRAAKVLKQYESLCEVAYHSGYADQAHMTREMRRWFGKTPSQMRFKLPQYTGDEVFW